MARSGSVTRRMGRRRSDASPVDRKSTRLNSSHSQISYAVFCLKNKNLHDILLEDIIAVFGKDVHRVIVPLLLEDHTIFDSIRHLNVPTQHLPEFCAPVIGDELT